MSVAKPSVLIAALLAASPAAAQVCKVRVNATNVEINVAAFGGDTTRREQILSWPSRRLNLLRGELPTCSSDVTLKFMAGIEGLPDTHGYCLAEGTPEIGFLLVPGERDFRGRCRQSTCQRINGYADDVIGLADQLVGAAYGPSAPNSAITEHASGALVLRTGKHVLQDMIEETSVGIAAAILSSPAAATATGISVVAVGGTIWVCN